MIMIFEIQIWQRQKILQLSYDHLNQKILFF